MYHSTDCEVEVLYACLITCPWYAATQKERGEQAKHNSLFVVYQSTTEKFVSPVNAHLSDQTNVIDKVGVKNRLSNCLSEM